MTYSLPATQNSILKIWNQAISSQAPSSDTVIHLVPPRNDRPKVVEGWKGRSHTLSLWNWGYSNLLGCLRKKRMRIIALRLGKGMMAPLSLCFPSNFHVPPMYKDSSDWYLAMPGTIFLVNLLWSQSVISSMCLTLPFTPQISGP